MHDCDYCGADISHRRVYAQFCGASCRDKYRWRRGQCKKLLPTAPGNAFQIVRRVCHEVSGGLRCEWVPTDIIEHSIDTINARRVELERQGESDCHDSVSIYAVRKVSL